ncbi:uncharacterized protein LOC128898639 [Dryobates pubescens]|uniref:uncharacterized protein LOC128898639 n=1 Tax=Dryobates pubescens TaxID=118200 RepID=UPI0023B9A81C|nr:uncharacterized protein LOC128898639 [Dryobates pubescens]
MVMIAVTNFIFINLPGSRDYRKAEIGRLYQLRGSCSGDPGEGEHRGQSTVLLFWRARAPGSHSAFPPRRAGKAEVFLSAHTFTRSHAPPRCGARGTGHSLSAASRGRPKTEHPPRRRRLRGRAHCPARRCPAPPLGARPGNRERARPERGPLAPCPAQPSPAPPRALAGRRVGCGARPPRLAPVRPLAPTFVQPQRPSRVGGETPCEGCRHLG